ncbi:MAG: hypothetical protein D6722_10300 [Bacteroidetes bacterium]|nr:MAG: hypothetical protein D6722_10300 [Bacteroidota bacterium]
MKAFYASCLLLLLSLPAMAQMKPSAGDVSFGFRFSGLNDLSLQAFSEDAFGTPELLGRYFFTDQMAVRLRIGANIGSTTEDFSDSYIDSVRFPEPRRIDSASTDFISSSAFSFTPGFEYHFNSTAQRLDPYAGAEIVFGITGATNTETDRAYLQADESFVPLYQEDLNIKTRVDGGISVGMNLLAGFNYFFSEKIAIGAEYGLGFLYTRNGGDVRVSTQGTLLPTPNPDNLVAVDRTETFQASEQGVNFGTIGTGSINLSVFF